MDNAAEQRPLPQIQLAPPDPSLEIVEAGGSLQASDLGLAAYADTLALQHRLREQRIAGLAPDTLLLLEHPPLFTRGRGSSASEFLVPPELLVAQGFGLYDVERGGKITYHGPGQLVGYPVISIRARGLTVMAYVAALEEAIIEYLRAVGVVSTRRLGYPGVWVGRKKIAAIGVHLRKWVSIHGFALNLQPNIDHFAAIVPCGIVDGEVTSVEMETGRRIAMGQAKVDMAYTLGRVLGYTDAEVAVRLVS